MDVWRAFVRVLHLRHRDWGVAYAPDWAGIRVLLQLHGLWRADVVEGLEYCFVALLEVEAEDAKHRREAQDAVRRLRAGE